MLEQCKYEPRRFWKFNFVSVAYERGVLSVFYDFYKWSPLGLATVIYWLLLVKNKTKTTIFLLLIPKRYIPADVTGL